MRVPLRVREALRPVTERLAPVGPQGSAGPLTPPTQEALDALVATLLDGQEVDRAEYVAALVTRAARVAGYRELYERFRHTADAEARQHGAAGFAAADLLVRRAVLALGAAARPTSSSLVARVRAVRRREWAGLDRYVLRPVLLQFAASDAWTAVGYPERPGSPRSLESYQHPVPPSGTPEGGST